MNDSEFLQYELKQLIVTTLRLEDVRPEDIASDQPLFIEFHLKWFTIGGHDLATEPPDP